MKLLNKMKMTALLTLVFGVLPINASENTEESCALEGQEEESCWYIAGSLGASQLNPDENTSGFSTFEDRDSAFKLSLGYSINEHWFTELTYLDLGQAELAHANPSLPQNMSIDYSGFTLTAGYYLLERHEDFNIYIKAGLGSLQTKSNFEEFHEKQHSSQLVIGVGAQWQLTEELALRVEVDALEQDAKFFGLGLAWYF